MNALLTAFSTWLHVMSTILMVGYYIFTGLIFLPVLARQLQAEALRSLLEQVSARLRPYFAAALLAFIASGTYLMMTNQQYLGLGHFFANPWSALIVIKHFIVLAFLILAFTSERAYIPHIRAADPRPLRLFQRAVTVNILLGTLIILLTAVAQVV